MPSDDADSRALDPKHFGEELMSQRKLVLTYAIAHSQHQAATTGLYGVSRIANPGLKCLCEQSLDVAEQQLAEGIVDLYFLL